MLKVVFMDTTVGERSLTKKMIGTASAASGCAQYDEIDTEKASLWALFPKNLCGNFE